MSDSLYGNKDNETLIRETMERAKRQAINHGVEYTPLVDAVIRNTVSPLLLEIMILKERLKK